jgi:uncharacterized protein (DUF983 family)
VKARRVLYASIVRSRCPCCLEGPIFAGVYRFQPRCPSCGLEYEQWVGDWITPTYIAGTAGTLVAVGFLVLLLVLQRGLEGPLPAAWLVCAVGGASSLLLLRPAKSGWLAFMYLVGGVEVSAETRAHLRWEVERGDATREELLAGAEARARSRPLETD